MADPNALAEKIAQKAADLLDPMRIEMAVNNWPPEFRKIMWDAVSQHAAILASESVTANKS